jgi:hypothetical protein
MGTADLRLFRSICAQLAAGSFAGVCACIFLVALSRFCARGDNRRALARSSLLGMFGVYSILAAAGYAASGHYAAAAAFFLIDTVPWLMFYASFAVIPKPLDARTTRVLAALIAIWSSYTIYQRALAVWNMRLAPAAWPLLLPIGFLLSTTCMVILLLMIAFANDRPSDPVKGLQDLPGRVV